MEQPMPDALEPSDGLLVKLGSALVHADEAMSKNGVALDEQTFRALLADPEIQMWIGAMNGMGLLPVKRDA